MSNKTEDEKLFKELAELFGNLHRIFKRISLAGGNPGGSGSRASYIIVKTLNGSFKDADKKAAAAIERLKKTGPGPDPEVRSKGRLK